MRDTEDAGRVRSSVGTPNHVFDILKRLHRIVPFFDSIRTGCFDSYHGFDAASESILPDGGDRVWDGDAGQRGASRESTVSDGGDRVWDGD